MINHLKRSAIKTIGWAFIVIPTSTLVFYLLTGRPYISFGAAVGVEVLQMCLYYLYDILWSKYG